MGAMRRAERIIHIKIAQFRERFGEFRIVRLFFRLEADVFQQGNVALLHVPNDLFRNVPDRVLTEDDRMMDE